MIYLYIRDMLLRYRLGGQSAESLDELLVIHLFGRPMGWRAWGYRRPAVVVLGAWVVSQCCRRQPDAGGGREWSERVADSEEPCKSSEWAELCGLRWSDIDEDGPGLTLRQTIVEVTRSQVTAQQVACPVCAGEHVGRLFKRPKSRRGRRWVPLARPARAAFDCHREAQQNEQAYLEGIAFLILTGAGEENRTLTVSLGTVERAGPRRRCGQSLRSGRVWPGLRWPRGWPVDGPRWVH